MRIFADDDGTIVFTIGATSGGGEDLDKKLTWASRMGGGYMGVDRAEELGTRDAVEGEPLVRVTPTRVGARTDVAS